MSVRTRRHYDKRLAGDQPKARLLAWSGEDVAGMLTAWPRPDGLTALYFVNCQPEAYSALLDAYGPSAETSVCVIDIENVTAVGALRSAGFTEDRGELDVEFREDIPGSAGWQPDPEWFRAQTYDSPQYDPRAYIVAVDETTDEYVGLARIWINATPRHATAWSACATRTGERAWLAC